MALMRTIAGRNDPSFQNLSERGLSLDQVRDRICRFVAKDPVGTFHLVVGTDSQVHKGHTKFVTGIVIHRVGRGAWACYRQLAIPRQLTSIREKLILETAFSQRLAMDFEERGVPSKLERLIEPHAHQGAALATYIDIDAGTEPVVNKTALYVQEMVERVEAMGSYVPRVKPEACVASSYANRYTKQGMVL